MANKCAGLSALTCCYSPTLLEAAGSAAARRRQPAAVRALAPAPREQQQLTGDTLAKRVEQVFEDTFYGGMAAPRVLDSFRRLQVGPARAGCGAARAARARDPAQWLGPPECLGPLGQPPW